MFDDPFASALCSIGAVSSMIAGRKCPKDGCPGYSFVSRPVTLSAAT
jgi:hypothetical protein